MLATIIGALLPIVVVLLLGFFSVWQKDFTGDQATILNRMVLLHALPLLLFGSIPPRRTKRSAQRCQSVPAIALEALQAGKDR